MTRTVFAAFTLALATCAPPHSANQEQRPDAELVGRVAGVPQRCVSISSIQTLRLSDSNPHLLLYGNGRTIWANSVGPDCSFRRDDIPITQPTGSSYCRGDVVRSIDRISHFPGPTCVFGDFIPYRRP
jgi:hypothetical protein